MEMKVVLKFDASDSFLACVEKFAEAAREMAHSGVIESLPEKGRGIARAIVTEDSVRVDRKEKVFPPVEEPAKPAAPAEAAVPTEKAAPAAPAEVKAPTVADVRAAMDRCRKRIEGENYATDTKSEGYQKYHKALTAEFKRISALLGSDKPSGLAEDQRRSFIDEANLLDIMEDGSIGKPIPF
jgi:hypothetical protein